MRTIRPTLLTAALLAVTAVASYADQKTNVSDKKGVDCKTIAAIRLVAPFNLAETSRQETGDCTSSSTYTGTGLVEMATCGVTYPDGQVPQVNARVELKTTTTLNECGDGFTNGRFSLILLDANGKETDSLEGTLTAVNRNFGELQGILEGSSRYQTKGKGGNYSLGFRATFTAAFVDPDGDGEFDTVSVSDAHGVTFVPNKDAGRGNDGDEDEDED